MDEKKKKLRFTEKSLREAGFYERSRNVFIHESRIPKEELKELKKKQIKQKSSIKEEKKTTDEFCYFVELMTSLKITMEHKFHKTRRWKFDYAIIEHKIAIEQEGGVYTKGRHVRPEGYINDMEKYNQASLEGWTLIRRTPSQMKTQETIDLIYRALERSNNGII
jgi:hypothetical protein